MKTSGQAAQDRIQELRTECDRYRNALIEVDMHLAADPTIWRLTAAAKAGEVLCEVLGAETIQEINKEVAGG